MTGLPWDASYRGGPAPWDLGRPQQAIVRLSSERGFVGTVLDAGCGSGENALHIAALGHQVVGIDVAETALAAAREKAKQRALEVEFLAADALEPEMTGRKFDVVVDCGLFHTFDADERQRYVASLTSLTAPGATVYILCFSDEGPETGPHPVTQEELRAAFRSEAGWRVVSIERDRIETRFHTDGAPAWLATMQRGSVAYDAS